MIGSIKVSVGLLYLLSHMIRSRQVLDSLTTWPRLDFLVLQFQLGHLQLYSSVTNSVVHVNFLRCLLWFLTMFYVLMYRKCNAKSVQPIKATATEAPPIVHSK